MRSLLLVSRIVFCTARTQLLANYEEAAEVRPGKEELWQNEGAACAAWLDQTLELPCSSLLLEEENPFDTYKQWRSSNALIDWTASYQFENETLGYSQSY